MRRLIPIFLIILLSLPALAQISKSSAPAAANNATTIQAYFGPKAADDNTGPLFNLLRFLDTAQTSIYGSIHEIDMIVVAEKLAARANAGVDIQIIVES